jgi:hypothetical protein
MRVFCSTKRDRALTLIEVMVVVSVAILLAVVLIWPALQKGREHDQAIRCINNLKQVGFAFRIWDSNHGGQFPMAVPKENGGSKEFITGPNAFRHFQVMSNELSTPKILICPAESGRQRGAAATFDTLSNSGISYFVGIDAQETNASMLLSGDHNIMSNTPITNGILELTTNDPISWTSRTHKNFGILVNADGSVFLSGNTSLRAALEGTGVATNRLQMP